VYDDLRGSGGHIDHLVAAVSGEAQFGAAWSGPWCQRRLEGDL